MPGGRAKCFPCTASHQLPREHGDGSIRLKSILQKWKLSDLLLVTHKMVGLWVEPWLLGSSLGSLCWQGAVGGCCGEGS